MFILSKVVGFLTTPSNLIAVLGAIGVGLSLVRFRRSGLAAVAASIALLLIVGLSPVSTAMLLPLTERFPQWQGATVPDGIVVLGGAIDSETSAARNALEMDASAERITAMLQLARRYPEARIVFSGGSGIVVGAPIPEAPIAGALLDEFGLSNNRVILESASRTTEENAVMTRALVSPKPGERWLLVTSAFHMPRSVGLFRAAGFTVDAYPVDFRSRGWRDLRTPFGRISQGLARADVAAHEWIGLIGARLSGQTREFLPSP